MLFFISSKLSKPERKSSTSEEVVSTATLFALHIGKSCDSALPTNIREL